MYSTSQRSGSKVSALSWLPWLATSIFPIFPLPVAHRLCQRYCVQERKFSGVISVRTHLPIPRLWTIVIIWRDLSAAKRTQFQEFTIKRALHTVPPYDGRIFAILPSRVHFNYRTIQKLSFPSLSNTTPKHLSPSVAQSNRNIYYGQPRAASLSI